jgi:serine/threonine-protein kinase
MSAPQDWDSPTEGPLSAISSAERRRIEAVLDEVLRAPPSERGDLLAKLCGDDDALLGEVRSQLTAQTEADDLFDLEDLAAAGRDGRVGAYRLQRRIGKGGMGTVYLADRADGQYQERVAVKVVKRGMDTEEILSRFLRERQILARLRHPNIAALLDGGVTADGRPYLVMEHVQGMPITDYCDRRRLPLEERLALFCSVCDSVGFAHRNLVVHRDLKPSNVLVDIEGRVKLLDFGIAKLLAEGDEPHTAIRLGVALMTPEYASPEQVRGEAITTAVDVYQLGLLLYELLTGRQPQRLARRGSREIEHVVCKKEPTRPSAALATSDGLQEWDGLAEEPAPEDASVARGTTPERLRRQLRGDLDTIALTALQKDPERRYPSAEALAADVRRHLDHQPVLARGDGLGYRAVKLLWRHRRAALAVVLGVCLLAISGSFYALRIQAERDRARLEAAKASRNAGLLERLFETWNPATTDPQTLRPQDLLDLAVKAAEEEPGQGEEERAAMLSLLGALHTHLEAFDEAESLLDRALAIQERAPEGPTPDLAATVARRGRLLRHRGELEAAEQSSRRALGLYQSLFGSHNIETLRARRQLARILYWRERFREAEDELRGVLALASDRGPVGETSLLLLEVERDLGFMLYHQGRLEEAAPLLEAALERSRETFGAVHAASYEAARQLASTYRDQGNLVASERLFREALETASALFGEDHEEADWTRLVYAMLKIRQGEYAEAEALARRTVDVWARSFGEEHPLMAPRLLLLGGIRLDRGDLEEAEELLRRALAIYRRSYPEGHQDERDTLNRLAYVALALSRLDGPALYREALLTHRERFTELPLFLSDGAHFLAAAARISGEAAVAESLYRESVALYRGKLAPGHPYLATSLVGLGETLLDLGRPADAEPYLEEGLAEWRQGRAEPDEILRAESALARSRQKGGG